MHVAVVIPAFNAARWLPDCLRSLRDQTYEDWSAIVVDDGSTDATPMIPEFFGDPRMAVLTQDNVGVSAARNTGIASIAPRADAVLFLDSDDWLALDALHRLTQTLQDSPWAVASCGGYASVDPTGRTRHVRPPPEGAILPQLLVRNLFVNGGHMLIRREAIDQAGRFRPDLRFGEDWEYWTRLALLGEFVSLRNRQPTLYVRERQGSAYRTMAADPASSKASLDAIFANPAITNRLGSGFTRHLRHRAEAEADWVIGRELIRRGRTQEGRQRLVCSLQEAPSLRRLGLIGLSWLRSGPFRPYPRTA